MTTSSILVAQNPHADAPVPKRKPFPTLQEAHQWAYDLVAQGIPVEASRIWYDRISKPRCRQFQAIGVSKKAEAFVHRVAPGGHWTLEVSEGKNGCRQLMAWYSKFAPYAFAMTRAEEGFECLGIDFDSINAYFRTCIGFVWLGTGQDDEPDYHRIESADTELFGEIYCQSTKLLSPDLPFDEAFRPCLVFLAARHPKLYAKQFMDPKQGYKRYHPHTLAVLQAIGQPIPTGIHRSVE
jgi:hypothetical protein